jgi:hypothetical protein
LLLLEGPCVLFNPVCSQVPMSKYCIIHMENRLKRNHTVWRRWKSWGSSWVLSHPWKSQP